MSAAEALVPWDGSISDDSSFYGDEETSEALEKRSRAFNATTYWSIHGELPSTIAHQARAAARRSAEANGAKKGESAAPTPSTELVYPHEGDPRWYQRTETVSEFLKRCPPLTTICEETGIDWFWISNPHASAHSVRSGDTDDAVFQESGFALLDAYRRKRTDLEKANPGMNKGVITRKLIKDREQLKRQIAELACETGVVCGKWMLFPHHDDLPRVWKQVCSAVLENRLGHTAKVSTTKITETKDTRLICIYTKDCFDVDDVRRVLLALVDLGLASDRDDARGIWYKMDAYTYLNLNSGNEFNLPASLYSSKEMLKDGGSAAKRKAGESLQKQSKGKQRSLVDIFP